MVRRAILLGVLFLVVLAGCQTSKINWGPAPIPGSWHSLPVFPSQVSGVATAVVGSNLYVIGGGPVGQPIPTEVFDLLATNGSWSAGPAVGENQSGPPFDFQGGAVTLDNKIYYLTCCNNGPSTDDFWVLDTAGTWSKLGGPPEQVSGFAMGAMKGKVYLAGGTTASPSGNGSGASSQLYAFDPTAGIWSTPLQTLPQPMPSLAGTVVGGTAFYVAGSGSALRYDPGPDKWTPLNPDPDQRATSLVAVGGRLFSVGGIFSDSNNGGTSGTNRVEVYDIAGNGWLPAPPLPLPEGQVQPAVLGSAIYLVGPGYTPDTGGNNSFGLPDTNTFLVFHPGD